VRRLKYHRYSQRENGYHCFLAMEKKLIVDGVKLAVKQIPIEDNDKTIVFLHDSLGCIELWRDFPRQVGKAANCNVLIYDRQGYGKSDPFTTAGRLPDYMEKEADVLIQLLDNLGIDRVSLFGHSDGGSIALIAASKYPDRIDGVITEGAHIFVEEISLTGIKEAIKAYDTTDLKVRLQKYHGDKTGDVFWAWAGTWLKAEFAEWSIENFLPDIVCPVLVIQGENDEFGSIAQVDGIYGQVSGSASKLVVAATGHNPHKDTSDLVISETVKFLSKI
jgi:pimeloyl-ACP methyl ester carboxylesterase